MEVYTSGLAGKLKSFLLFFVSILSLSFLTPDPVVSNSFEIPYLQKGLCYATWDKDRFLSPYSDMSLKELAGTGADFVQIIVTQYQENPDSTDIRRTEHTPSDKSLVHAIKKAQANGLKVMLKPHIDLINNSGNLYHRADIGFAREKDWREWFDSYSKFILHYARIAEATGVNIFCVGTELSFTTQKNDLWEKKVIFPVREIYKGKLIYAANWDNYSMVEFWDELDYVGIDAYFPLTAEPDPSVSELSRGWKRWQHELAGWQSYIGKPVIFTEIGYPSAAHAGYEPWKSGYTGNADPELQARCYKAFFNTVWGSPWLKGVYWWKWDTSVYAGGKNNRQFTPQNKPAEKILKENYRIPQRHRRFIIARDD
ncbi:MAG: hypothetical protein GF408_02460 [Candidatus Omnitrophica bacterium]|nr:hypothetical protein [Candidatus Omnitrophota bacterium]